MATMDEVQRHIDNLSPDEDDLDENGECRHRMGYVKGDEYVALYRCSKCGKEHLE